MIFFLDIDGVLVHANPHRKLELEMYGFYKFNPLASAILKNTIYKSKDKIVLSSSHRYRFRLSEWKNIFKRRGLDFLHFSILNPKKSSYDSKISRKHELLIWIEDNWLSPEELVIIDDDKSLNDLPKEFKVRLLLTDPYKGLDTQIELKKLLKRRVKKIVK